MDLRKPLLYIKFYVFFFQNGCGRSTFTFFHKTGRMSHKYGADPNHPVDSRVIIAREGGLGAGLCIILHP